MRSFAVLLLTLAGALLPLDEARALDWYLTPPATGAWPLVDNLGIVSIDYYVTDGTTCAAPRIGTVQNLPAPIPASGAKVSTLAFENTAGGKTVTLCATAKALGFISSVEVSRTDTFPPARLAPPVLSPPR